MADDFKFYYYLHLPRVFRIPPSVVVKKFKRKQAVFLEVFEYAQKLEGWFYSLRLLKIYYYDLDQKVLNVPCGIEH